MLVTELTEFIKGQASSTWDLTWLGFSAVLGKPEGNIIQIRYGLYREMK